MTWVASSAAFQWFVTDQGTPSTGSLGKELITETHARHHFTTAYCPWANVTVARVCQEVLRVTAPFTHKMRLAPTEWSAVMECAQSVINQSPLKRVRLRDGAPPGVH